MPQDREMPMATDQQIVTALAKACGAKPLLHFFDYEPCMQMLDANIIRPLIDYNNVMFVQERLCGDAEFRKEFLLECRRRWELLHLDGYDDDATASAGAWNLLTLSPSDRCRALFAALLEASK